MSSLFFNLFINSSFVSSLVNNFSSKAIIRFSYFSFLFINFSICSVNETLFSDFKRFNSKYMCLYFLELIGIINMTLSTLILTDDLIFSLVFTYKYSLICSYISSVDL